jgi:hypothetical protein
MYRADYGPPGFTSKLRLADAADFSLRAVTERSFIRESPFVRY